MKKLLALVLSMLLVASCFALVAVAEEETTEGEATEFSTTLVFGTDISKEKKILNTPNGINKVYYNSEEWEGARLKLTDVGDPYVYVGVKKMPGMEQIDSQAYPFVVFKLKIEGYVDDFELFYCAGSVSGADPNYATTTDYNAENTGDIEYIIFDLTGDCEGNYNQFRFDPMGADEDTFIYLYELALFATEEEAIAYAGLDQEPETTTSEETTEETTEEETEEKTTAKKPAATTEAAKEEGCGSIISIGAVVAMISLGVVCIKKKD